MTIICMLKKIIQGWGDDLENKVLAKQAQGLSLHPQPLDRSKAQRCTPVTSAVE